MRSFAFQVTEGSGHVVEAGSRVRVAADEWPQPCRQGEIGIEHAGLVRPRDATVHGQVGADVPLVSRVGAEGIEDALRLKATLQRGARPDGGGEASQRQLQQIVRGRKGRRQRQRWIAFPDGFRRPERELHGIAVAVDGHLLDSFPAEPHA